MGSLTEARAAMRIGIPRAIHYYLYPGLWEPFFSALGMETVVSPETSGQTIQRAARISEAEHCLPVKLLEAHVESLVDKVDYLFLPRLLSQLQGHVFCTKLAPLPDVLRLRLNGGRTRLLTVDIRQGREPLFRALVEIGAQLTEDKRRSTRVARAILATREDAQLSSPTPVSSGDSRGVILLGHPYLTDDPYFTGPVIRKLDELLVPVAPAELPVDPAPSVVHWETSNRMYAFLSDLQPGECAGIVHLSCFNCGCDSMSTEFFREIAREKRIPYLVLMLDEHSAWGAVETRLEAFVDSIRWQH